MCIVSRLNLRRSNACVAGVLGLVNDMELQFTFSEMDQANKNVGTQVDIILAWDCRGAFMKVVDKLFIQPSFALDIGIAARRFPGVLLDEQPCAVCADSRTVACPNCDGEGSYVSYER